MCTCLYLYRHQWDLIGGFQIQLKELFLISCIGKMDKFPNFLVVACEHMVLKL